MMFKIISSYFALGHTQEGCKVRMLLALVLHDSWCAIEYLCVLHTYYEVITEIHIF